MFAYSMLAILGLVCWTNAIPIDNGVEGDPEIECSADSLTINFNVRNDFNGHVYVKGRFADGGECRTDGGEQARRVAGIKLPFASCGTKRERSLNPKGIFVSNTIVITFHPQFLTKVDRAYTVQCFYMEADKTVSQDLEVSEITTALATQGAQMPVCRYDILEGGPEGLPVKFAIIGQQVYHKWTCDTETVDMFCALVHSCSVDDGAGNSVQLLNEQGCALDRHLLGNLEYQTDLTAGHESHVFKYADKPALFFDCQISILGKEPGQPCQRPQCPEAGGPGGVPAGSVPPPSGTAAPLAPGATRGGSPPPRATGTSPRPGQTTPPRSSVPPAATLPLRATSPPGFTPRPPGTTPVAPAPIADRLIASRRDASAIPASPVASAVAGRFAPRQSATIGGRSFRFRYARAAAADQRENETAADQISMADTLGTLDVAAPPISTLEIGVDEPSLSSYLDARRRSKSSGDSSYFSRAIDHQGNDQFCVQPIPFAFIMTMASISGVLGLIMVMFACFRRRQHQQREEKF